MLLRSLVVLKFLAIVSGAAKLPVSCIARHIDNGEHKFDENGDPLYVPFPVCSETARPLEISLGQQELINCTYVLEDEQYHLMQLYLHEDVPYSCRVQLEDESYVKMPLVLHGNIEKSHIDVDTKLNLLMIMNPDDATSLDSAIGLSYNSGQVARHIIGDEIQWQFQVSWYEADSLPSMSNMLHIQYRMVAYCVATFIATVVMCVGAFHLVVIPRRLKSLGEAAKLD